MSTIESCRQELFQTIDPHPDRPLRRQYHLLDPCRSTDFDSSIGKLLLVSHSYTWDLNDESSWAPATTLLTDHDVRRAVESGISNMDSRYRYNLDSNGDLAASRMNCGPPAV